MPDHDIARTGLRRHLLSWLSRLLPVMLFAVLVLTPLLIWMIKKQDPVFEQVRMGGRVAEVTQPTSGTDAPALVTVELEDGTRVVVRTGRTLPDPGATVTLIRTVHPGGDVSHDLEGG